MHDSLAFHGHGGPIPPLLDLFHLPLQEGPFIRGAVDGFGEGGAGTVAGAGVDADEDGRGVLGLMFLEARGGASTGTCRARCRFRTDSAAST